ncbi:hypothetical protein BP6252_03826 [Coleophoma cylindrospora]|uniref:N-acetylgalactosaminide beta-1,3-galactosyltransferase n=1 Tax=Coleophoma cylindrospora TaxID=1849047 RepID=A0A3D8S9D5_9HELO|nr:hypothetical protein BP6252_03826 [Coleophoma cylindrospora]
MLQALARRVPFRALCFIAVTLYLIFHDRPPRNFIPHFKDARSISKCLQSNLTSILWTPDADNTPSQHAFTCPACPVCSNATTATLPCSTSNDVPLPPPSPAETTRIDSTPSPEQQIMDSMRAQGIQVVFKTGAQELAQLAINLGTTLRFFDQQDVLFFSDMHDSIGPFTVHDALRNVNQNIRDNHPDFEIYRKLKQYHMTGQNIQDLVEDSSHGDGRSGWKLDKWKFLHMIEEAFEMRPNAKWYVFIETDSYVMWRNLVAYLQRFDHRTPLFLGSALGYGSIAFAHGGSGYVISNAAMNKLLGPAQPEDIAARWDSKLQGVCCGDMALADALHAKGVDLTGAHPFFNGYKPTTLTYGPQQHWCQPVVTMHHVIPADFTLFADLYHYFVEPHIAHKTDNWDNLSHGPTYTKEMLDEDHEISERKKKLDDNRREAEERKLMKDADDIMEQKRLNEDDRKDADNSEDDIKGEAMDNEDDTQRPDHGGRRPKRPLQPPMDDNLVDATLDNTARDLFGRKKLRRRGWEVNEQAHNKGWEINGKVEHKAENKKHDEMEKKDGPEAQPVEDKQDNPETKDEPANENKPDRKEESEAKNDSPSKDDSDPHDNVDRKDGIPNPKDAEEERAKKEVEERRKSEEEAFQRLAIEKEVERQMALAAKPVRELSESEKVAHESFANCRKVCAEKQECFQFVWWKDTCKLGLSFRLGKYQEADRLGEGTVSSGWMVQRIRDWTAENACTAPRWEWY